MSLYIALEGIDGCGKSTQAEMMARAFGGILTRENGGTAIGQRIRSITHDPVLTDMDPMAEMLLFAADRAQHISQVVAPALAAERTVVSDRSLWSSIAYQGGGRGVQGVYDVNMVATRGVLPQAVVLLDVSDEVRHSRLSTVRKDRIEVEGEEFYRRVWGSYLDLHQHAPGTWVMVDGNGSPEQVHDACMVALGVAGVLG